MHEPINVPHLNSRSDLIPNVLFKVVKDHRIRRPEDWEDPLHLHDFYEIFFNLSSNATMYLNGQSYPLLHGSAVIIPPRQVHVCRFHKTQLHEFFCLWIDASQAPSLFSFLRKDNLSPLYTFDDKTKTALIDLLFTLTDLSHVAERDLETASCLLQIIQIFQQNAVAATAPSNEFPKPLTQVINYIQQNFAEISHIKSVAQQYFVSPATLNRWFRQYLHTTPHEYLEMHKLKHAERLLANGESVTNACMYAGFPDCSHFIALFRKKFGMTPLCYKRSLR